MIIKLYDERETVTMTSLFYCDEKSDIIFGKMILIKDAYEG